MKTKEELEGRSKNRKRLLLAAQRMTQLLGELRQLKQQLRSVKRTSYQRGAFRQVEYVEMQIKQLQQHLIVLQTELMSWLKQAPQPWLHPAALVRRIRATIADAEQSLILIKLNAGSVLFL